MFYRLENNLHLHCWVLGKHPFAHHYDAQNHPKEKGARRPLPLLQLDLHTDVVETANDASQIIGWVVVIGRIVSRIDRSLAVEQVLHRAGDRDVIVDIVAAGQIEVGKRSNMATKRKDTKRVETTLILRIVG